jgi:hypothetical protein
LRCLGSSWHSNNCSTCGLIKENCEFLLALICILDVHRYRKHCYCYD